MASSRRLFLQRTGTAAAAALLSQWPARRLWAAAANDLFDEPDERLLRELALAAIEAARAAGAEFADARVTAGRSAEVRCGYRRADRRGPIMEPPEVSGVAGYGVRAIVDGAWGFASGYELTPDAVRRVAQAAVERARSNRPRRPRTLALAPAPVVAAGRWATPIERDPFAVPFGEQADRQFAALAEAVKVPEIIDAGGVFGWKQVDRVFASTEGTLLVQRYYLASPGLSLRAVTGGQFNMAGAVADGLLDGGYGYEAVTRVDLAAALGAAAVQAVAHARSLAPPRPVEVGRYDLVFSHRVVAALLAATIGEALNLERVLGYRSHIQGTSFAGPPDEILGRYRVGAPLLTVRADRTRPHGWATVGWDDEGVAPEEYTAVRDGVIVDYHTDRQMATRLAGWYGRLGAPVHSHGTSTGAGQERPRAELPNLTLEPGRGSATVDDLIADTRRGLYVDSYRRGRPDHQLLTAQYKVDYSGVREIRNGKLGARIDDMAFQFVTPQLWKQVDALGGPASAGLIRVANGTNGRDLLQLDRSTVSAVPARVRQVNVLNVGRTA